ncbi:hypothetical protein HOF78_00870 [Candidatus Woesearchaeota archaeon]|jgi:DNA repair protein SbcC/Rad50|nr:hypothetical protein [Candidatus Woesearchaeota archaeon]MBT6045062.1 hypothetical protein [Candidatus Woesearchaeota archaeon]
MVQEVLIPVQKYVTVLLLFIAAFMWLLLRKNRGEEGLVALRINRAFTVMVLVVLPFIVGTFSFFSEDIARLGMSFLLALIFLILLVVLFKFDKINTKERNKDFRDLMKDSQKHPIKFEFARRIVAPEIKKLKEKEKALDKKRKKFSSDKSKEMKVLKIKEKKLDEKLKRSEELSDFIKKNQMKTEERSRVISSKLENVDKVKKEIVKKESNIEKREKHLESKIDDNKKRKNELESLFRRQKLNLAKKTKEVLLEVRDGAMREIRDRESELEISKAELGAIKRDVSRRERNLNPRINSLEKRESEIEKRFSKVRIQESEIREALDNLQILRKQFAKEEKMLRKDKSELGSYKSELGRKEKRAERMKLTYSKNNNDLIKRETELDTFEGSIKKRKRDLDALERRLARKNKEISTLEVRLNKQLDNTSKKDKLDGDVGDIISDEVYTSNKKVRRKNGNK